MRFSLPSLSSSLVLVLAVGALQGCSADATIDPVDFEATAELQAPLLKERNGTVLFNDDARRANPNVTRSGYAASVRHGGCSGALIGPNLMMSAAHCDGMNATAVGEIDVVLYTSRGSDRYGGWHGDTFKCRPLLRTFEDADLMLYYCPDKNGVAPGDLFGYLDFEVWTFGGKLDSASVDLAKVGTPVWTVWQNNLEEPAVASTVIFQSKGKVKSRAAKAGWPAIQGTCDSSVKAPILATDVWVKQGVSGSSTLSDRGRLLGGPTSTASDSDEGNADLTTNAIYDFLTRTRVYSPTGTEVECDDHAQLNQTNLAALGLDWHDYVGAVDDNGDGLFDVQLDAYKATMGKSAKPFYFLGFDSNLRNRAMTGLGADQIPYGHMDNLKGFALLDPNKTLKLPMAKVVAGKSYVFAGVFLSANPSTSRPEVCAGSACAATTSANIASTFIPFWSTASVKPSADGTISVKNPSSDRFILSAWTAHEITGPGVSPVNVAAQTFDTHDARWIWRSAASDDVSALFLPVAGTTPTGFAMGISQANSGMTRHLPLMASGVTKVCFDVRIDELAGPVAAAGGNKLQVTTSTSASATKFSDASGGVSAISTSWLRRCAPLNGHDYVKFESLGGSFLIDNVQLTSADQTN